MLIRATAQKVVPLGYSLVLGYDNTLIGLITANKVPSGCLMETAGPLSVSS